MELCAVAGLATISQFLKSGAGHGISDRGGSFRL